MTVTAAFASSRLTVEPGSSTTFEVTVRNLGSAPEEVRVHVSGPAAPFSWVVPDPLTVEAAGEAVVRVGFRVPRISVPAAGPLPFQVHLAGRSDPAAALVLDGVLDVARFSSLSATLTPVESSGRGPGRHQVTVGNRGNAPVPVRLEATDAEGLVVRFDPPSITASPDETATATVEVTPTEGRVTGDARTLPFTVVATPEAGDPVEVSGRFVQQVAVAVRTLVAGGAVVAVAVVTLLWATVFSSGSSPSSTSGGAAGRPASATSAPSCPAAGHHDTFGVSGLNPEDIPKLPNSYSFFYVKADGCSPVRFNPCEPVHYVQNATLAPPTGAADVREAFNRLSRATGITFVDDGLTDETGANRGRGAPFFPDRYGQRWAPILVTWLPFGTRNVTDEIQVVGRGIGQREGDVLVSGILSLNVDAVTDREANTPLEGGFGPPLGSGTGAIGPKGVTWGRVILHELAHVMGLGHTRDKGAIMYPETAEQTSRPTEFRPPDLEGLRFLGREAGCLTTPPLPGA